MTLLIGFKNFVPLKICLFADNEKVYLALEQIMPIRHLNDKVMQCLAFI